MAKICRPIAEYREIITNLGVNLDDYKPPKKIIKRFIKLISKVDDSRLTNAIIYPLKEIILTAFFAILAGASTWNEISEFGDIKFNWLRNFLEFENGTPSHDTYRRVFALINPEQLNETVVSDSFTI
jgi:hypothetical protein